MMDGFFPASTLFSLLSSFIMVVVHHLIPFRLKIAACELGQGQVDVYGILSVLIDKRLQQLIAKATEGLSSMTDDDLVETVDAVAGLGYYPEHDKGRFSTKAFQEIKQRLKEDLGSSSTTRAPVLVAALNRIGYEPKEDNEDLLLSLLGAIQGQLKETSTASLVTTLSGLGEMALEASEEQDTRFQEVLSSASAGQSFDGADLFPPLYTPQVAPYLSTILEEVVHRIDTFTPSHLHIIMASLSILRYRPPPSFFHSYVKTFMYWMNHYDPSMLASTLRALVLTSRLAGQPLHRDLLLRTQEVVKSKEENCTFTEKESMKQGLEALRDAVTRNEKATLTFLLLASRDLT